ncbi:MAG TPA: hypothetical protein VJ740_16620 [Hyphomicrobiaceae bacterium]|nr:hypothetical protein [Hyphomicrobiaceae bacterium]
MMNKAMTAAVCACLAGIMALAPAAHAKGGGGHHTGGGGMKFSSGAGHHHHHHFRVFRRDTITVPSYNAEENRVRRIKPATPAIKAPVVKYADGKGRVYDPGSKAWCDGNGHCWSGPLAWTFKDGTWFYGDARWYEAGGTWRTDAAAAPRVVDCESIPAFAALKPTTGAEIARGQTENASAAREASATAAPAATKSGDCKKYFPSIGGMVSVPCEG